MTAGRQWSLKRLGENPAREIALDCSSRDADLHLMTRKTAGWAQQGYAHGANHAHRSGTCAHSARAGHRHVSHASLMSEQSASAPPPRKGAKRRYTTAWHARNVVVGDTVRISGGQKHVQEPLPGRLAVRGELWSGAARASAGRRTCLGVLHRRRRAITCSFPAVTLRASQSHLVHLSFESTHSEPQSCSKGKAARTMTSTLLCARPWGDSTQVESRRPASSSSSISSRLGAEAMESPMEVRQQSPDGRTKATRRCSEVGRTVRNRPSRSSHCGEGSPGGAASTCTAHVRLGEPSRRATLPRAMARRVRRAGAPRILARAALGRLQPASASSARRAALPAPTLLSGLRITATICKPSVGTDAAQPRRALAGNLAEGRSERASAGALPKMTHRPPP